VDGAVSERRTEQRNPRASALASFSTRDILELMNDEDHGVPDAVRRALPRIEEAVEAIVAAFARGGRVRYFGAGTSGRLGVLDASEAPPTFGVDEDLVRGVIAGGDEALRHAIEGAEDDPRAGEHAAREHVRAGDVAVGISAGGIAKYVIAAVKTSREIGATSVALTCDAASPLTREAAIVIAVDVGPEVLAGSSRLKAGTATKLVLNMLTTAAMIRSGRTRGDLMIDLKATNAKLRERAVRIVREVACLGDQDARASLEANGWSVSAAIEAHRQR